MLNLFKIQIFEVVDKPNKTFIKQLVPLLDTMTVLDLSKSDHFEVLNFVKDIINKENINVYNKRFRVYINIDSQFSDQGGGVIYKLTYKDNSLVKVEINNEYFMKLCLEV